MHVNRIGILASCYLAWIHLKDVSITNRKSGFYFFFFFFVIILIGLATLPLEKVS